MKKILVAAILLIPFITPVTAGYNIDPQRETGEIILYSLTVKGGILSFRTATGGCTDKRSLKVNIETGKELPGKVRHYILTITRTAPDECKALLDDGVVIEYSLEKDLGLKGNYAVTVKNIVMPGRD